MTQAVLSWLLFTLSPHADSDGDHRWRKPLQSQWLCACLIGYHSGKKAWSPMEQRPLGWSVWITLFSVLWRFLSHLKLQVTSVFLGLLLIGHTTGIFFECRAIQQEIGWFRVSAIWIYELKCVLWCFLHHLLASLNLYFFSFQELSGILGWCRKMYVAALSKTASYIIAVRSKLWFSPADFS